MNELVIPRIHDNGTGADDLKSALETAYNAIDSACDALSDTSPNPRDYDGIEHIDDAYIQYRRHDAALRAVMADIEKIMNGIDEQTRRTKP